MTALVWPRALDRFIESGASVSLALYVPRAIVVGTLVTLSTALLAGYFIGLSRVGACGRCGIDWNAMFVVGVSGLLLAAFPRRLVVRLMVIASMTAWSLASIGPHASAASIVRANEARLAECVPGERSFQVLPSEAPGGRTRIVADCIVKLPTLLGLNGSEWSVVTMRFAALAGLLLASLEALAGLVVLVAFAKLKRLQALVAAGALDGLDTGAP